MNLQDPLARVRGLGSAKDGTRHWWVQRLTAVLLLPLSIWFVICVGRWMLGDYADARFFLLQPVNNFLMMALVLAMSYHALLGVQVVIEDYIHVRWLEIVLLIAAKLLGFLFALGTTYSLLRIAMGV